MSGANRRLIGLHYHGATALDLSTGAIVIGDANGAGEELAPGTNGYVLTMVTGSPAWAAATSPTHNLLSATHPDTTAASPVRGDIITAQGASPLWTKLAKASPASGVRALLGFDNGDTEPAYKTTLDSTTPVTITAGGAGAAGTSLIFARRDHDHPAPATYAATAHNVLSATHGDSTAGSATRGDIITAQGASPTWTRLARSVPAANVLNVLGLANGDTEPAWKTVLDATAPTTIAVGDSASAGTSLVFAHRDHVHGSPATYTATAHNLLSATHGDTLAASVVRGSIIVGNSTPKWSALAIGTSGKFLRSDGTDAAWTVIGAADLPANGANPSASLGLAAVNGSATTWMRSDGAPALDQSIAPTWTGVHLHSAAIRNSTYISAAGVTTAPSNTTAGDGTLLRAHIGTDAAFTSGFGFETNAIQSRFGGSLTLTTQVTGAVEIKHTLTNNTGAGISLLMINGTLNGSGDVPGALALRPIFTPSGSINDAWAGSLAGFFNPAVGITITRAIGFRAVMASTATGGAITNALAIRADTPVLAGGVTPTNVIGIEIQAQSGGTNNYDLSFGTVDTTAAGAYYGRVPVLYNGLKKYVHVFSA